MAFQVALLSWRWWLGLQPKVVCAPPPRPSISVVIPAWNEADFITQTVQSVRNQTYPIAEIVVVDDGSEDATGDIARSLGARVIRSERDGHNSKARAQNLAISSITTELFATVDADTVLAQDAVERTLRFFNDRQTCAVCGLVLPARIRTLWERGRFFEYLYSLTVIKPGQSHTDTVLVASGCFTVFRTDVVRKYGGFKSRTIVEDMDLTWELKQAGYRVYYAGDAISYPVEPPTYRIFVNQLDRWYRGFLQNLRARNYNLFPIGIGFALLTYFYVIMALSGPVGMLAGFWWFTGSLKEGLLFAIFGQIALQVTFVWSFAMYKAYRLGMVVEALKSVPAFMVVQCISLIMFYRAIWREIILGQTLEVWIKGHPDSQCTTERA